MSTVETRPLGEGPFVLHWIREAGRGQQILFLSDATVEGPVYQAGQSRLHLIGDTIWLTHHRGHEIELATFAGHHENLRRRTVNENPETPACFLLNGNGFEEQWVQALQARIRQRTVREHGEWNVMVAPFDALHAAGINLQTIQPIEIAPDVNAQRTHNFDTVPVLQTQLGFRVTQDVQHDGLAWRFEGTNWDANFHSTYGDYNLQVQWQPPNGRPGWYRVVRNGRGGRITYNEHRLGSAVFWGEAANGRHRYISAFDMAEDPPMYFLAQLPDGPEVTNYDTAIEALAPPIVRQAHLEGRATQRHGDIFFIATNETDDSLLSRSSHPIHQRQHTGRRVLVRGGRGGGSRWNELPPSRRSNRRVCIFGTGHTADRVVETDEGCTFVQGVIRHEPYLVPGDGERQPEHRDITLREGVWHLCVRNTVPSA